MESSFPTRSPSLPSRPASLGDFTLSRRVLLLCALAAPIGCVAALVAKALLWLIAVFTNAAFFLRFSAEPVALTGHDFGWWGVVVPVLGGLVIGFMARYGSEKIRGHGIPEALEAILLGRSLMNPRVAVLKPLSSAICIGSGGPFGAEGPIIVTGGAFGSVFAQLFHLTSAERKTLLVAGAAAGMTAIFATPIAAVLLAVELLLFEWKPRSLIPVSVAAVVALMIRQPLLGTGPIFPVMSHGPVGAAGLAGALLVGVVIGLAATLLTKLVYACEDGFSKLRLHWMWWPAVAGVFVGLGGLIDPRVLGVGYETIHALMRGEVVGAALVGLILAKSIVWAIALGSGTSGGILAPLLMVGGAVGSLLAVLAGAPDVGLWAMIGMAAMMGGTMGAPLTGALFLLELTHDLQILPALLVATVASLCITVLLLKRSVLTEKLARRGQHVAREYAVDVFTLTRVEEVMDRNPPVASAHETVAELMVKITQPGSNLGRRQAVLVEQDGRLVGIVTRSDLLRVQRSDPAGKVPLSDAATRKPITVFADETLGQATDRMLQADVGRLPVVARNAPHVIVGYLGRSEILMARRRWHDEEERRERGLGAAQVSG
ncbi:MAG: chloride channel protein [Opitutaceae bacterium]|nr:chloride channel protein [Cephaloticoccus sp.]MCP5530184.1 chloride channel protein [Opitutaceae bacterium]